MRDYRLAGPEEARKIARESPACGTAPNGTGSRCACDYACANHLLRAAGFTNDAS